MNQPSSSTSSSRGRRGLVLLGWVALWLIVFDIGVNLLFAYPSDPKDLHPNRLELYFDYGRSMEGRLRRATRADPEQTAPITLSGWYDPLEVHARPAKPSGMEVSVYGMSHSVRLADALQKASGQFAVRSIAAPGASTNWAYGAYLRDEGNASSEAVVLTVMPSNLPMIRSMSAMTWNNSFAMPFTSDRFIPTEGGLKRIKPPYESFAQYVEILNDPVRWEQAKAQFEAADPFYDSFLFERTVLDNSTIVRLVRRGWGQRRDRGMRANALNASGYDPADDAVRTANAIVADFARTARSKGQIPVIYIVNNRGYQDQMYRALADTLQRERIPYLSSHTLVDPGDPRNFLPDNHFTDANDFRLAQELDRLVARELESAP